MFCFFLAEKLGKNIDEILDMPSTDIYMWMAYFKVKNEIEEKQIEEARRKSRLQRPRRVF